MPSVKVKSKLLEWRTGKVVALYRLIDRNENRRQEFDAELLGPFAIHDKPKNDDSKFDSILTHVFTGLRVCNAPSGQLRLIAAVLVVTGKWCWKPLKTNSNGLVTREEWDKTDLPSWVPRWVKACNKSSKYLDPDEFKLPSKEK